MTLGPLPAYQTGRYHRADLEEYAECNLLADCDRCIPGEAGSFAAVGSRVSVP